MAQYNGSKCAVTTLRSWCGENTAGHHILPKSSHPQHRYEPMNMIPLAPHAHRRAHDSPEKFMSWLERNRPEQHAWVIENDHHRDYVKPDYKAIYEQLNEANKNKENGNGKNIRTTH